MDGLLKTPSAGLLGYENLREPYLSELSYFVSAPNVAGMATEDNRVILNPFNKSANQQAVYRNEMARLLMRQQGTPQVSLTDQQNKFLDTTDYRGASEQDRRQTILARLLSGDKSAQTETFEQNVAANKLRGLLAQ